MPLYCYFFLTLIIELPIVVVFYRKQWKQAVLVGLLLNLFTWPLLHIFLFESRVDINLLEIIIAVTEGLGYYLLLRCKWWKAMLLSFLANGISYGIGILINQ